MIQGADGRLQKHRQIIIVKGAGGGTFHSTANCGFGEPSETNLWLMDDIAKLLYEAGWLGALLAIPAAFFKVKNPLDRLGLVLSSMALALLGFYDYRAWKLLPQDFTANSIALGLIEIVAVAGYASAVAIIVLAEWLVEANGTVRLKQFRLASLSFFIYSAGCAMYWAVLYYGRPHL